MNAAKHLCELMSSFENSKGPISSGLERDDRALHPHNSDHRILNITL